MSEWWTWQQAVWIGSIGGSGLGMLGGLLGTLVGVCAPRGVGRQAIVAFHVGLLVFGAALLAAGLTALAVGQPYHVWYPLVLGGGLMTPLLGVLLPVVRGAYRQAERRKLEAEVLRRN
jgi:hypothetical protein